MTRLLSPAASMRLAPVAVLAQAATLTLRLAVRAASRVSVTVPALRLNSVPAATLMVAWLTWPSVRLVTLARKLALPVRLALPRFKAPTALLALMPVSATGLLSGLTSDTLDALLVPLSCSA